MEIENTWIGVQFQSWWVGKNLIVIVIVIVYMIMNNHWYSLLLFLLFHFYYYYYRHNWHQGGVVCVDVHPKNSLSVTGARDGTVKLSNAKTHRVCFYLIIAILSSSTTYYYYYKHYHHTSHIHIVWFIWLQIGLGRIWT